MNMTLIKSFRDLMIHPWRTALVIVAMMLGIWGISSVISTYAILRNDLNDNYRRTSPAQTILTSDDFAKTPISEIRAMEEIESAEFRDYSMQRIEVRPDEWIPLWLFGIDDFSHMSMAHIYRERGSAVPAPGTILVERNGLLISGLAQGSTARIRVDGAEKRVPVSGICFDPAMAPATQDHFIYAYTDAKTFRDITGEPSGRRLILRIRNARSRADVTRATERVIRRLNDKGIAINGVRIPKFNEHPHQWQLNVLIMMQGIIGFLGFFIGIALVSQLMSSILSAQIRQIGILKAIGASRARIFGIYSAMISIMGIAAGLVAVPLAVRTGFAFARFVAMKLNFDILTTRLPHPLIFAIFAAGVLIPLLVSLPAILRGMRIPAHMALNDYGISPDVPRKSSRGRKSFLPLPLALSLRNTTRRTRRLMITVTAMAFGAAIFCTGFNMRESLRLMLEDVRTSMRYDIQIAFKKPLPEKEATDPFSGLDNVAGMETWNGGRGVIQTNIVSADGGVGIVAIPENSTLVNLRMSSGRWFSRSGETEVVMNHQAHDIYPNAKIGGYLDISIGGNKVRVRLAGIADELDVAKIYMSRERYDAIANPGHLVNSVMITAADARYDRVIDLKKRIERIIAGSDLQVMYVMSRAERVKIIYDHLNVILITLVVFAFLVLIVSAFGMASATGINVMERTREIGVMRATGATPGRIRTLFTAEGMIVSVVSIAFGLALSLPLSAGASFVFGRLMLGEGAALNPAISPVGIAVTIAATGLFGWIASRLPARKALTVSTAKALSYE